MMTLIPAAIALITMANASQSSTDMAAPAQWRAEYVPSSTNDAELSGLLRALNARTLTERSRAQAVFVVPGPDLPAEKLGEISEDMIVMCRIVDKVIVPGFSTTATVDTLDPFAGRTFDSRSQTQGLYLDGYGALFFVEVGFPLLQPPQETEQPKTEQSGDPLWSQTVDELRGVPAKQSRAEPPAYDAGKVNSLKATLIRSLRHAANLRIPGPQDHVTVVITTRVQPASSAYATTQPQSTLWVGPSAGGGSDVLVLQTTKPDVDAFAKDSLSLEEFTKKVRILRSWSSGGQQATLSTGTVLPSAGTPTAY